MLLLQVAQAIICNAVEHQGTYSGATHHLLEDSDWTPHDVIALPGLDAVKLWLADWADYTTAMGGESRPRGASSWWTRRISVS